MDDLLFDVPKNRTKLDLFKERNGVWTYKTPGELSPEFPAWFAMLFEEAKKALPYKLTDAEQKRPGALLASYGYVIEGSKFTSEATTEEDACFKLAQQNKLEWP